jgi:hypothetical protein
LRHTGKACRHRQRQRDLLQVSRLHDFLLVLVSVVYDRDRVFRLSRVAHAEFKVHVQGSRLKFENVEKSRKLIGLVWLQNQLSARSPNPGGGRR